MRILITGSGGMLGRDLVTQLEPRHEVVPLARQHADVTDARRIVEVIGRAEPEAVIHCAAFTAVDDCESQPERAMQVNGEGTRNVALACRECGCSMVYVSTDYVFDGEKSSPYVETDQPHPINVYGRSKLDGERRVMELLEPAGRTDRASQYWIVRVSWLFGPLGKNFVRAILDRAGRDETLRVVDDQTGAPTYTADAAAMIEQILGKAPSGIYHVTNQGYCSWFEFAAEIVGQARSTGRLATAPALSRIATAELNRAAHRPGNSRLANVRLQAAGLDLLPPWQDALRRYLLREDSRN